MTTWQVPSFPPRSPWRLPDGGPGSLDHRVGGGGGKLRRLPAALPVTKQRHEHSPSIRPGVGDTRGRGRFLNLCVAAHVVPGNARCPGPGGCEGLWKVSARPPAAPNRRENVPNAWAQPGAVVLCLSKASEPAGAFRKPVSAPRAPSCALCSLGGHLAAFPLI